ncbi:hypothetical protein HZS_1029, partial [Henneguya salminicola]
MQQFSPPALRRIYNFSNKLFMNFTSLPMAIYKNWTIRTIDKYIRDKFCETFKYNPNKLPLDTLELVYFLLRCLPFNAEQQHDLISISSLIHKVHSLSAYLKKSAMIECINCSTIFCNLRDVIIDNSLQEMIHSNLEGEVFDLVPVKKIRNCQTNNAPSLRLTFFENYSWDIAFCVVCSCHIGWRYSTTNSDLIRSYFYGVCRK